MVELIFIGMIYESIIIIITIILLILIFERYQFKKQRLTLILFIIFLNLLLAIVSSWLAKILVLYSGIDYIEDASVKDPGTPVSWILLRISSFRISFVFVTVAVFYSYILKVNVFENEYHPIHKIIVVIYGVFTLIYSLVVYQKGINFLDIFAFLFVLIYMIIIYIPFLYRSLEVRKTTNIPIYRNAFLSLAIMSLCLILVFVNFLIDQVIIFLGYPSYTIFYFAAWTSAVIAVLGAYLGYIRPKSRE